MTPDKCISEYLSGFYSFKLGTTTLSGGIGKNEWIMKFKFKYQEMSEIEGDHRSISRGKKWREIMRLILV